MSDVDVRYARFRLQEASEGRGGMTAGGIEYCRGILAAAGEAAPPPPGYTRDHLGRLVAAADQDDDGDEKDRAAQSPEQKREAEKNRVAVKETERMENQRKGNALAGEEVLGLFADGSVMTVDGCPSGVDPVDYLRTPGAVLAPVGKTVLRHLEALAASDPTRRARGLGINLQAVTAAARREGLDPAVALKAEVEFREMIDRERAADGLAPAEDRTAPVADGRIIGGDGDPAKAEADLQALVARENAAAGVKK